VLSVTQKRAKQVLLEPSNGNGAAAATAAGNEVDSK
jgi:hypothetical protein